MGRIPGGFAPKTARALRTKIREIEIRKMRGRKPKPVAQQITEGDPRKVGKRKLQSKLAAEPPATRGLPTCPQHLKGWARKAWNFWRTELQAMQVDHRPDAMMLEGACVAYENAVWAYEQMQKGRILRIGENLKPNPAIAIGNEAWRQLHSFCSEFGLSPVSRTRLSLEKDSKGDADLMELLSQPRERKPPLTIQ